MSCDVLRGVLVVLCIVWPLETDDTDKNTSLRCRWLTPRRDEESIDDPPCCERSSVSCEYVSVMETHHCLLGYKKANSSFTRLLS